MNRKRAVASPVPGIGKAKYAIGAGFMASKTKRDTIETMEFITYRLAQIHNKGDRWFVFYSYRNPATGKMQRFKMYEDMNRIKDLKKRQEYAEFIKDAVNYALTKEGLNPFIQQEKKLWTFGQALTLYQQHLEGDNDLRKKTIQSYMTMIKVFQMFPGYNTPITKITQDDILNYLEYVKSKKNLGNKTYNGYLGSVRTWFGFLIKKKIIEKNIMDHVERRKTIPTKHKAYTRDEFDRIFTRLKLKADHTLYWYCKFIYYTGTRPQSETRLLQIKHVLFDRKLLYIPGHISKNRKDDYIPLADELLTYLTQFKDLPGDYYIFAMDGPGPKPFGINTLAGRFKEVREELNLDPMHSVYGFKHTRAIHLAEAGISPYLIMQLFRHSGLEITMKYLRDLGLHISREAVEI